MTLRNSFLIAALAIVGLSFFAANQAQNIGIYVIAGLAISIIANSLISLSLALFSLRSMGLVYITRASAIVLAVIMSINSIPTIVNIAFSFSIMLNLCLFSEKLLSKMTRDIGANNENVFTLKTPITISFWFIFTWGVVWATFAECIHLFASNRTVLGIVALVFGTLITGLFLSSQLRIFYRRCVIVPHGIVASDPITMTDVVLLPLSKISTIELIKKFDISKDIPDTTFVAISSPKNIVAINLTQATDSLIVRNSINETERKNVDRLLFSIADANTMVKTFHTRFHKVQAEELTRSQEKMVEKELGIQTAPRSDSPLPAWRKKKPKT